VGAEFQEMSFDSLGVLAMLRGVERLRLELFMSRFDGGCLCLERKMLAQHSIGVGL
jgi:hypothetical protein